MKNKKVETENKEGSSQKEEVFFVQSNIDDLLNNIDNLNNTKNVNNSENLNNKKVEELKIIEDNLSDNQTASETALSQEKEASQPEIEDKETKNFKTEEEKLEKYEEKQIKEELKAELVSTLEKPKQEITEEEQSSIKDQRKKLDEAEQSVSKHNSKKSKILNLIFFFVNIAVVVGILAYQLTKEELETEGIRLSISYLLVVILLFAATMGFETLAISYLVKQSTGKWQPGLSYKVAGIGRYYDSVTPMSSGGQPFQISYMKSRGMPLHTSLSIPLAKYEFHQMAWVVMSLICLIISWTNDNFSTFVSVTSIIGFVIGFVILFVTVFLSVCKSLGKKIVVKILKLLYKMKIIKNYDKQYEKITKYISDFQDVMKQFAKSPKDFISMFLICFAKLTVNYSMPYFIVKLFMPGLEGSMYMNLFVMSMLVDLSSSFFPLPGGTGLNEISFQAAFASVIGQGNILVLVLLVWRFFSYYIYLLQGLSILSYDMAYGNRKYKWQVKRDKLAEESAIFKQNQIDRFREERAKRRKTSKKNNKFKEYL